MARKCNGSTSELTGSGIATLSGVDAFTLMIRYKASSVDGGSKAVAYQSGGGFWQIIHTSGFLVFAADGLTDAYPIAVPDATDWHTYIWRHVAGAEMAVYLDTVKTVLDATVAETINTITGGALNVGHAAGASHSNGAVADLAGWTCAVHDAILDEIGRGVSPIHFPTGRQFFFALNGHNAIETDYSTGNTLVPTATTTVDHPRRVPSKNRSRVEPAWLVDIIGGSTVTAASRDLYTDADFDVIGETYPARLTADITLVETIPDAGGVVDYGQCVLQVSTYDGGFSKATSYQGDYVRVRKYDRVSQALTTEFVGYVDHQVDNGVAGIRFDCRSDDPALRIPIPRLSVEIRDEGATTGLYNTTTSDLRPIDTSAPYPVACGDGGMCIPPYIELATDDPTGQRFLVAWGDATVVKGAWSDTSSKTPGLEKVLLWDSVIPGSPTYASSSTFTVAMASTDEFNRWFRLGYQVRKSTDYDAAAPKNATWAVARVTAVVAGTGTITVSPSILTTPLNNGTTRRFEVSTELIIEDDQWEHVAGTTTPLITALNPTSTSPLGRIQMQLSTTARTNPADLAKFIIEDPDMGMDSTLNASDYSAAVTAFSAAGLGSAIRTVLGGDGSTREARKWLNDIAMLRGCRIWRDNAGEWRLTVDSNRTLVTLQVGYGLASALNYRRNLLAPQAYDTIPESSKTSVLKLQYAAGGREQASTPLQQVDYAFRTAMTVHGTGSERRIPTVLIRDHDSAALVTWYIGKRLEHGVKRGAWNVDHDAWRAVVGDIAADQDLGDLFRILRKQQTLTTYSIGVAGHDSEIFETNLTTIRAPGGVAQPTNQGNPDERKQSGGTENLIPNPDFSTGLHGDPSTITGSNFRILPEWVLASAQDFDSLAVVSDPDAIGGRYLSFDTPGSFAGTPFMIMATSSANVGAGGRAIQQGVPVLFSGYFNSDATAGQMTGFSLQLWFNNGGSLIEPVSTLDLRIVPGDVNLKGWPRVWGMAMPPTNATRVQATFRPDLTSTHYEIDALMMETQLALSYGPSKWIPSARTGLKPVYIVPGEQTARVEGTTSQGLVWGYIAPSSPSLTGASTVVATLDEDMIILGCSFNITTGVTMSAGTTFDLRIGSATGPFLARAVPQAVNTQWAKPIPGSPQTFSSGTVIYAVPTTAAATFSAGVLTGFTPFKMSFTTREL